MNTQLRLWHSNLLTYCGFAIVSTAIAVVLFACIVVVQEITVDGVSRYVLEGFMSALTVGLIFSVPIPIIAVLVGYPLWFLLVPRLEQRGWSRPSILVAGSSAVSLIASLGFFWIFWEEVSLLPDLITHFLLITIPGVIGANISARLSYLRAE